MSVAMWPVAASRVPGLHCHGGLTQDAQHMDCIEAADAMAFQELSNGCFANADCLGRRRHSLPKVHEPFDAEVAVKVQESREIAPELLAQAVGYPISLQHRCW